jgi:hypothetical protein
MILNADEWVLNRQKYTLDGEKRYMHSLWRDAKLNDGQVRSFVPVAYEIFRSGYSAMALRRPSAAGTALINLSTREPDIPQALNVLRAFQTIGEVVKEIAPLSGCDFIFNPVLTNIVIYDAGTPDSLLLPKWSKAYAVRSWLQVNHVQERDIGLLEPEIRLTDPPLGKFNTGPVENQIPFDTRKWRVEFEWQIMPVGFRCAR